MGRVDLENSACNNGIMSTLTESTDRKALDRLLNPLSGCLTLAMARRIIKFRADAETQARVEELAVKSDEGELTPSERREYQGYVRAIHLISILQSKARIVLAKHGKGR